MMLCVMTKQPLDLAASSNLPTAPIPTATLDSICRTVANHNTYRLFTLDDVSYAIAQYHPSTKLTLEGNIAPFFKPDVLSLRGGRILTHTSTPNVHFCYFPLITPSPPSPQQRRASLPNSLPYPTNALKRTRSHTVPPINPSRKRNRYTIETVAAIAKKAMEECEEEVNPCGIRGMKSLNVSC